MIQVQLQCHNELQASNGAATISGKVRETHNDDIIFYFIHKLRLLMMIKLLRNVTGALVAITLQVREACV